MADIRALTKSVDEKVAKLTKTMQISIGLAISIGQELIEVKKELEHGEYGPWLKERGLSTTRANVFVKLSEHKNRNELLDSESIREAEKLLKKKPTSTSKLPAAGNLNQESSEGGTETESQSTQNETQNSDQATTENASPAVRETVDPPRNNGKIEPDESSEDVESGSSDPSIEPGAEPPTDSASGFLVSAAEFAQLLGTVQSGELSAMDLVELRKVSKAIAKIVDADEQQAHAAIFGQITTEPTKPESAPESTTEQNQAELSDVDKVVVHYQTYRPRRRGGAKERTLIRNRLNVDGFSVEDLKLAIDGCMRCPHNQGDNDRGRKYDSLALIVRDSEKVNQFMGDAETDFTPKTKAERHNEAVLESLTNDPMLDAIYGSDDDGDENGKQAIGGVVNGTVRRLEPGSV